MRILAAVTGGLVALSLAATSGLAADTKKPPYFASIQASRARMRTGPARTYPASWLYQRSDLPVKVVGIFKEWRKIEDPDGETGWMQGNLLSDRRTAMVRGKVIEIHDRPSAGGKLLWRAAPGVIGRLSGCGNGWCRFDVMGRGGFVETSGLWGVEAGETLP